MAQTSTTILAAKSHKSDITGTDIRFNASSGVYTIATTTTSLSNLAINDLLAVEKKFLTLRNNKVNLRQGPSFQYPVKIFYNKKYLPVIIEDKSENFRKIRDHQNNSGWIHVSKL